MEEITKKVAQELSQMEEKELSDGDALYEMVNSSVGWRVVSRMLEDTAHHSWVDPRGMDKATWEFAELNAYHAANNANELLEAITKMISRAEYLRKVKLGEIKRQPMKI